MFFRGDEPLAVHLCSNSAMRICRDIVKRRMPQDDLLAQYVKPEYQKTFETQISSLNNFLKHADRDPDQLYEYHSSLIDINYFALGLACQYYARIKEAPRDFWIYSFSTWILMKSPELRTNTPTVQNLEWLKAVDALDFTSVTKQLSELARDEGLFARLLVILPEDSI